MKGTRGVKRTAKEKMSAKTAGAKQPLIAGPSIEKLIDWLGLEGLIRFRDYLTSTIRAYEKRIEQIDEKILEKEREL